ncbi:hypothetical protein GUITHDRAFT_92107, partial [Guillardia theta CCMP2712]
MPSVVTWMPAKGGKQGDDVERMRGGGKLRLERTFAIIKPDAVAAGKAQEMKDIITASGFKIVKEKRTRLSEKQAKEFYEEHKERPFYSSLVQFMTGGDCIILVLQKENAIKGWRELMGPTNSLKAKTEAKDSLRAKFGTDGSKNACHGSDSPKSARREIRLMFGILEWIQVVIPFMKFFW